MLRIFVLLQKAIARRVRESGGGGGSQPFAPGEQQLEAGVLDAAAAAADAL